ncbi:hypothetical protein ACFV0Y_36600 [Streptomyces sp. NPDC059569]|uniref:hypothetical protein n=1 Tax=Streptomyces sp. NPDC059569 TaxID=3346869 RepID=UPI0036815FE1
MVFRLRKRPYLGRVVSGNLRHPVTEARRPGDAARAVAAVGLIAEELGWTASRGVREMVESAWEGWRLHHPAAPVG